MSEYIDRQAVLDLTDDFELTLPDDEIFFEFISPEEVKKIPAADVAPVRRGKWMRTSCSPHRIYCSECYGTFIPDDEVTRLKDVPHRYCPKCGAETGESG